MAVAYFMAHFSMQAFLPLQKSRRACRSLLFRISLYRFARRGRLER
jgi:hypothetical protein